MRDRTACPTCRFPLLRSPCPVCAEGGALPPDPGPPCAPIVVTRELRYVGPDLARVRDVAEVVPLRSDGRTAIVVLPGCVGATVARARDGAWSVVSDEMPGPASWHVRDWDSARRRAEVARDGGRRC